MPRRATNYAGTHFRDPAVEFRGTIRAERDNGVKPLESFSVAARIFGNRRKPVHLETPSLMRFAIALNVGPLELVEARLDGVDIADRAGQQAGPQFRTQGFALGF